jgi:hypothetical protein
MSHLEAGFFAVVLGFMAPDVFILRSPWAMVLPESKEKLKERELS